MKKLRYLSLCSGIEAASCAWQDLRWEPVAFAEIDPFCCTVLADHYPAIPNLGDISKIEKQQIQSLGQIDVCVFGFPCQDLSVSGLRKGLSNADGTITRSGLFHTARQIAEWSGAIFTVVENVPGLFSSNGGRDFASVVGGLAGSEFDVPGEGWRTSGVALGAKGLVEWCVLDAQWFGLAQRRKRVFLVLDSSGSWFSRPPILLVAQSLRGDSPPSRQAGQRVTVPIAACSNGGGANRPGGTADDADSLVPACARSLRAQAQSSHREDTETVIPIQEIGKRQSGTPMNGVGHGQEGDPMYTLQSAAVHGVCATITKNYATHHGRSAGNNGGVAENQLIAHALKADGFDAGEDGTGRGTPIVLAHGQANAEQVSDGSPSLTCNHEAPIVFDQTQITSVANRSNPKSGEPCHTMAKGAVAPTIAFKPSYFSRGNKTSGAPETEVCHSITSSSKAGDTAATIHQGYAVRRLTPTECERLMGFPDGWTAIKYRGKKAADGPRYKALGNSMAVPVLKWIGERIELIESLTTKHEHE